MVTEGDNHNRGDRVVMCKTTDPLWHAPEPDRLSYIRSAPISKMTVSTIPKGAGLWH